MTDRAPTIDRLVAAGLLLWAIPDVPWWWRPPGHGRATPVVLGAVALALAQSAPFLWRRRWPWAVLLAALACLAARQALGQNVYSAEAATVVAAYGLGAYGGRRQRAATRVMAAAALVVAVVVLLGSHGERIHALPFALLAAALGMGEAASSHRDVAAVTAVHIHDLERARLARELHDVIAHQLSAIAVQAGAARMAGQGDPAVAVRAVATIEATARQGLVELNRLVGSLRHDGADRLDRAPQPQLCDLPALLVGARHAGLPVQLLIHGEPGPLPATVELAGYRVVQESVTNALRYAMGAPTRVTITYAPSGLEVEVTDDGSPAPVGRPQVSGGRGLAGLAERAAILGGRLEAGPRPGRGFAVHAWLPAER